VSPPLPIHLGGGRLIEADRVVEKADCLQETECPQGVDVGGIDRVLEGHGHVGLRPRFVDLRRPNLLQESAQSVAVGEITVVEEQTGPLQVRVEVEVSIRSVPKVRTAGSSRGPRTPDRASARQGTSHPGL